MGYINANALLKDHQYPQPYRVLNPSQGVALTGRNTTGPPLRAAP